MNVMNKVLEPHFFLARMDGSALCQGTLEVFHGLHLADSGFGMICHFPKYFVGDCIKLFLPFPALLVNRGSEELT
jgi:hypothetical protein